MNRTRGLLLACGLLLTGLLSFSVRASELQYSPRDELILPRPGLMRVSLDVLVDGVPVRTITHGWRTYLPVPRLGAEYAIRVHNHGPRRITAIVSVDGLSVINGQPASEEHPGYIVDPYSSIVIKGWRRDRETVAAFSFEERDKSYASRMGHPENVGVIGLIAIEEWGREPRPLLERKPDAADEAKRASGLLGGTGTGYGRDIESRVYTVPFVRSGNKQTVTIYYDTIEALRRAGIPVDPYYPVPFPGDPKYAPPPPEKVRR
jgi:hypothetical protein